MKPRLSLHNDVHLPDEHQKDQHDFNFERLLHLVSALAHHVHENANDVKYRRLDNHAQQEILVLESPGILGILDSKGIIRQPSSWMR